MHMLIVQLAFALALNAAAPPPGAGEAVLVARAVGPGEWRLESRPGGSTLRNIKLLEGQKIILIDAKGTREIQGPGELLLLSKGMAKDVPLFAMAFRAITASPGPTIKAGVRGGSSEAPQKAGWEQLSPRADPPKP